MRKYKVSSWAVLLVALALVLASCGKQSPEVDPTEPTAQGVLEVALAGVETADVIVASGEKTVWQGAVTGSREWTLEPGTYLVDGLPVANLLDPTLAQVVVTANGRTRLTLNYEAVPGRTPGSPSPADPVAALAAVTAVDMGGVALPSRLEVNANKDVMIYASQTEEPVCVTVRATDANGHPVAGAQLTVNTAESEFMDDRIAIIRGCAELGGMSTQGSSTQGLSTAAFRDSLYTDANGEATFTLYASLGTDEFADEGDVARIVVSAEGDGGSALVEFKLVPYNLAHLYLNGEAADMRTGSAFEEINIFDTNDRIENPLRNVFNVEVDLFAKQPEEEIAVDEIGFVCFSLTEGADVVTLDGVDLDDGITAPDGEVLIDPIAPGADCYRDFDGSLSLRPNDSISPEDLPIQATVRAVLYTALTFGNTTYYFPLKDVTVTKRYIGNVLDIDKTVENHVLTWYGDNLDLIDGDDDSDAGTEIDNDGEIDYTLDPANAVPAGSVFTTTVTLTVTNTSPAQADDVTATDVTLEDDLPAELGVIESSLTDGGTYNSVNHAITWFVGDLAPGESATRSFDVYVRQKPGFCVDEEDLAASEFYTVGFTFDNEDDDGDDNGDRGDTDVCYDDPYEIINGGALRDVTAAWFFEGTQQVVDFDGYANEDDVIIHAVRPIFDINKELLNPQDLPFDIGMAARFGITITNLDRTLSDPGYAELAAEYPSEFDGSMRDNPYARDVNLSDIFLIGLDYTTADPLTIVDDEGVTPSADYSATFVGSPDNPPPGFEAYLRDFGDKAVAWDTVPLMGGGDTGSTELLLNVKLFDPDFHINLAALTAGNMNQGQDLGDCNVGALLDYGFTGVAEAELGAVFGERFSFIADCAEIFSFEAADAWLELNDLGNYDLGAEELQFLSVVTRGDEFIYLFSVQNGGFSSADEDGTAERTTLSVTLDAGSADNATLTQGDLIILDPDGNIVATLGATSVSGDTVSFGPYDHPVGFTAIFVVSADADKVGNATATATVDWDADPNDTQQPFLPYSVEETVSIKPPQ